MDRYEFDLKTKQLAKLVRARDYANAAKIAETLEWKKIKQWSIMSDGIDAFLGTEQYAEARNVCIYAYNRNLGGKRLLSTLVDVYLELGEFEDAEEIYQEYARVASREMSRFTLLYKLRRAQGAPTGELIDILQEYKENELDEAYEYELAKLYAEAGLTDRCVAECDELVLWFAEGEYVLEALRLKANFAPLTPAQQEKLERLEKMEAMGISPDYSESDEEPEEEADEESAAENVQVISTEKENTKNDDEAECAQVKPDENAESDDQEEEKPEDRIIIVKERDPKYVDDLQNTTEWTPIEIDEAIADSASETDADEIDEEDLEPWERTAAMKAKAARDMEELTKNSGASKEPADSKPANQTPDSDGLLEEDYDIKITVPDYSVYDTRNVQQELKANMEVIMEAYKNREERDALLEGEEGLNMGDTQDIREIHGTDEFMDENEPVDEPTKEVIINSRPWRKASRNQKFDENGNTTVLPDLSEVLPEEEKTEVLDDQIEGQMDITQWLAALDEEEKEAAHKAEIEEPDVEEVETQAGEEVEVEAESDAEVATEETEAADEETVAMEPEEEADTEEPEAEEIGTEETETDETVIESEEEFEELIEEIVEEIEEETEVEEDESEEDIISSEVVDEEDEENILAEDIPEVVDVATPNEVEATQEETVEDEETGKPETYESDDSEPDASENNDGDNFELEDAINEGIEKMLDNAPVISTADGEINYALHKEERECLQSYFYMAGLERKVSAYVSEHRANPKKNNQHAVIMGSHAIDKKTFAIALYKAMHIYDTEKAQSLAVATAEKIRSRGFESIAEQLSGHSLIIENAGRLDREQVDLIIRYMDNDRSGSTFFLIDDEFSMNKFFTENRNFEPHFTGTFLLKPYSVNELANLAIEYANEQNCKINDRALTALYLMLDELQSGENDNIVDMIYSIIDNAVRHARRRFGNKLFGKFKTYITLKEADLLADEEYDDEEYDDEEYDESEHDTGDFDEEYEDEPEQDEEYDEDEELESEAEESDYDEDEADYDESEYPKADEDESEEYDDEESEDEELEDEELEDEEPEKPAKKKGLFGLFSRLASRNDDEYSEDDEDDDEYDEDEDDEEDED